MNLSDKVKCTIVVIILSAIPLLFLIMTNGLPNTINHNYTYYYDANNNNELDRGEMWYYEDEDGGTHMDYDGDGKIDFEAP